MNRSETSGGSSRRGQENGAASNESERPLKKARFAWQVKGKYHLKNDANETVRISTAQTSDPDVAESSDSGSNNHNKGTEQNLEMLADYLIKPDFNTLDGVIVTPEQSLLTPGTSISNEKLPIPRYVSSYEQDSPNNSLKDSSESSNDMETFPLSMVLTQSYLEDTCIARWQTKQMLKGFLDNTINSELDLMIQAPLPPEDDSRRSLALDVADFINNLPEDHSVENKGILMAISAHGLHPTISSIVSSSEDINYHSSDTSGDSDDSEDVPHEQVDSMDQGYTDASSDDFDSPWSDDDQKNECNDTSPFPLFPDATSLSYQEVNSRQNSSAECDGIVNTVDNHCDFLNEAILYAIQSKGLTTFGSDYG